MNLTLFKFLHIVAMFAAVTVGIGSEIVLHQIARTRNVPAIRAVFTRAAWLERISIALFGFGVAFGLIAAWLGIFNLLASWLLTAYALVVIIGLNGSFILGVWVKNIEKATEASPDAAPSPELTRLLADKRALYALIVDILLFVAVIYVMVTKPGGIR